MRRITTFLHSEKIKGLRNIIHRFYRGQRGSAAVISALSMVALMGFSAMVLDLGVSYNEASKLQNALDSAALAAVRELPSANSSCSEWVAAKNVAVYYAAKNGIQLSSNDMKPVYKDGISANRIIGIKLTKSIVVEYNFARVIGINSGTVTRSASAGLAPVGGITSAIPLSISASGLNNAIASDAISGLIIKCSSNADEIGIDCTGLSGWFGALRFDGTGASLYSDLISYGYSGVLRVGQELDTENGNMSGPTMDGFTVRYEACTSGCTAECHESDCPRLVYIPVVQVLSNSRVKIVSFATFFLEECGGNGNDSYIKATYVKDKVLSDAASGTAGQDFGLYVSKLLS